MMASEASQPSSSRDFPVEWYDCASENHFWMQWRLKIILGHLRALQISPEARLLGLDIGCGHGAFQRQLDSLTQWIVDGCDLNPNAIALNRGHRGQSFLYNLFDARPDLKGKYDLVFLLDVIEHVPDPVEFIRAARYYLKAGGHLVVNVPAVPALSSKYDTVAGHLRRYTRSTLHADITAAGLAVEQLAYWGLSLVPLLAARKLLLGMTDSDDVIKRGFEPPGAWADRLLRSIMSMELTLAKRTAYGSSLLAIARVEP
jgi:2-polyprenyl-3-methyl-5-hydroxy-6-metoxy-1,4-benzoquinol methylase